MAHTQDSFIEKVSTLHNNKYIYDNTLFNGIKYKITITCPLHGDFEQRASDHMSGNGCPECGGKKKYTQKSFIDKVTKIHPNLDFSKVIFINAMDKVTVTCKEHGDFEIPGSSLATGRGCPACGNVKAGENRIKTQEQFITELKEIYGGEYDYSRVEYKGNYSKVKLICPSHGEFIQSPSNLLHCNCGCPTCGNLKSGETRKLPFEEFIIRANIFHNKKYDYSLVRDYKNGEGEIVIICPEHGEFTTTPYRHLRYGCSKCGYIKSSESLKKREIMNYFKREALKDPERFKGKSATLYLVKIKRFGEEFLKVGYTERSTKDRMKGIHFTDSIDIIYEYTGGMFDVVSKEFEIHEKYKQYQFIPSVEFGGFKECFRLEILDEILKNFSII